MSRAYPIPTLGPELTVPFFGPGLRMRVIDDVRKCVVFFGYPDDSPGKGGINCIGTGFLLLHDDYGYLVTAKHLSHGLGDDPFLLRINRIEGGSENIHVDGADWIEHPDPTVDVSAAFLHINTRTEYDILYLSEKKAGFATPSIRARNNIGVGNFAYTIVLFRLLSGEKRNLPICHFGTVAMVPGDERIPVRDWRDTTGQAVIHTEGFLVEAQSLGGLSGSPVFVRPQYNFNIKGLGKPTNFTPDETDNFTIAMARQQVLLLGLWQGAWQAPPDEVRAAETGQGVVVPLGMGIVVPVEKILEVLDMPKAKAIRDEARATYMARRASNAAVPQSALPVARSIEPTDDNPSHREDFDRLLGKAAKTKAGDAS